MGSFGLMLDGEKGFLLLPFVFFVWLEILDFFFLVSKRRSGGDYYIFIQRRRIMIFSFFLGGGSSLDKRPFSPVLFNSFILIPLYDTTPSNSISNAMMFF